MWSSLKKLKAADYYGKTKNNRHAHVQLPTQTNTVPKHFTITTKPMHMTLNSETTDNLCG